MSRSVVQRGVERCRECQLPARWCICAGFHAVDCPIQIDVLTHRRELGRPTSTGRLIQRVMTGSKGHVHGHDARLSREDVARPNRTLWILHPAGELPPAGVDPDTLQVLLLDGSWPEAGRMRRSVESWGQLIRLPADLPPSRYGLRRQPAPGMYATIEALGILLEVLGQGEAATRLRIQFELHVYAGLRSRGAAHEAAEFLAGSLLPETMPGCLRTLTERRRCGPDPRGSDTA